MKKDSKVISVALLSAKTEEFSIFEENFLNANEFDISTSIGVAVYNEEKQIGIFLGVEYLQEEKTLVKILVSCHFGIVDKSWESLLDSEQTNIILPKDFFGHLVGITFATTRGILVSKTEGTLFSTFILPIFDVDGMIKEDGKFSIKGNNE